MASKDMLMLMLMLIDVEGAEHRSGLKRGSPPLKKEKKKEKKKERKKEKKKKTR